MVFTASSILVTSLQDVIVYECLTSTLKGSNGVATVSEMLANLLKSSIDGSEDRVLGYTAEKCNAEQIIFEG